MLAPKFKKLVEDFKSLDLRDYTLETPLGRADRHFWANKYVMILRELEVFADNVERYERFRQLTPANLEETFEYYPLGD